MYTLKLDYHIVDTIVVDVLKKDYISLCNEIESLKTIENRKSWDEEDLQFNIRICDALKVIFEYYLTQEEQKELFKA